MNMEERLQAVVSQAEADGSLWHTIIHGNNATSVSTENGKVPSVAKNADALYHIIPPPEESDPAALLPEVPRSS